MRTVEQLSIFLENKVGRLQHIMEVLSKIDTKIVAAMVSDTSEYGILRLITTDTKQVYDILKQNNITANISDVIALVNNSSANSFFNKLKYFTQENIGIEYMYSFSSSEKSFVILRVHDINRALEVIDKHNIDTYTNEDIYW